MTISVTILTFNSGKTLEATLTSLYSFSDIVILDSGSTDDTFEIAKKFPQVRFFHHRFLGFGPMHNRASSLAKYDWILSLDSDEILTEELTLEIDALPLSKNTVYTIARKNLYKGQHIRGCGWWPDRVTRLYNRTQTSFSDALVHEKVLSEGMASVDLKAPLQHTPFANVAQFIAKIQSYSELYAQEQMGKKYPSPWTPYLHGIGAFLRSFFIKYGCIDGWKGLEISLYNALQATYKYLKLIEKNSSSS